jgi:hypothetical protein
LWGGGWVRLRLAFAGGNPSASGVDFRAGCAPILALRILPLVLAEAGAFAGSDPARLRASSRQLRSAVSPVPKCEGPGAPSSWFGKGTVTGATRQGFGGIEDRSRHGRCTFVISTFRLEHAVVSLSVRSCVDFRGGIPYIQFIKRNLACDREEMFFGVVCLLAARTPPGQPVWRPALLSAGDTSFADQRSS